MLAALDAGVNAVITYLEQTAAFGRLGERSRPGVGVAAVSYLHALSRAEEPHLHVHTIVVNALPIPLLDDLGRPVPDPDGGTGLAWRALDAEPLHAHIMTAGLPRRGGAAP